MSNGKATKQIRGRVSSGVSSQFWTLSIRMIFSSYWKCMFLHRSLVWLNKKSQKQGPGICFLDKLLVILYSLKWKTTALSLIPCLVASHLKKSSHLVAPHLSFSCVAKCWQIFLQGLHSWNNQTFINPLKYSGILLIKCFPSNYMTKLETCIWYHCKQIRLKNISLITY